MNIGVFFGSFNPVHLGHVAIAEFFLKAADVDEVWLSVSPQNPWKEARGLAAMKHRVTMTELAVADRRAIKVLDFEKNLEQPSYTYEALLALANDYPQHTIKLLIGGDNCHLFDKWRNYDKILDKFEVLAYPRDASMVPEALAARLKIMEAPLLDFASTNVRTAIKDGQSVEGINPQVLDYIKAHKIYL